MFEKSGLTKNAHGQSYFLFFLRKVSTVKMTSIRRIERTVITGVSAFFNISIKLCMLMI